MIRTYRLLVEHRIDRILRPAGYEFEIPEQVGGWMVEQGQCELVEVPTPMSAAEVPIPRSPPSRSAPQFVPPRWSCCGGPKLKK